MPRKRQPPRLALRLDNDGQRRWIIRDGQRYRRTGCLEAEAEQAADALADYIGERRRPDVTERRADKIPLADILSLYAEAKRGTIARPRELLARISRLNAVWGARTPSEVVGENCRAYVAERGAVTAARRELETLRAAINLYAEEHGLDVTPRFALPDNGPPRERWLSRGEAALLLLAAMGFEKDEDGRFSRHKGLKREHLRRFVLLGLYTGTRHSAILSLQWMPNTTGGWADLQRGVLYRRPAGSKENRKRRPPQKLPPRLLAHLRRWHRADGGVGPIVRYQGAGEALTRIEKAFRGARAAVGLGPDVTPHVLRHTRATWLVQKGVDLWEAAGSLGMTVETLEKHYGHHSPDFQKRAAEAY